MNAILDILAVLMAVKTFVFVPAMCPCAARPNKRAPKLNMAALDKGTLITTTGAPKLVYLLKQVGLFNIFMLAYLSHWSIRRGEFISF